MSDRGSSTSFRRVLAAGLAVVLTATLANAAIAMYVATHYHAAVDALAREAALARRVRALGVFAREQYIHEAHTVILANVSHVGHQHAWAERFRSHGDQLERELPEAFRPDLVGILAASAALQTLFARDIVPATERGDRAQVAVSHAQAERTVALMVTAADRLGDRIEARAREEMYTAERAARRSAYVSCAIACIAALLALGVARILWRRLMTPLTRMRDAAHDIARGDTTARVGRLGVDELETFAAAFDQMLDRLLRRESELIRAERLATMGRLSAVVAHEINNPIGVIRGYVATMLAEVPNGTLRDELVILDEEAEACQRIVEDLLTCVHTPSLRLVRADPRHIVADAVNALRTGRKLHGHGVDERVASADVDCDPLRLRQVVCNLVQNAVDASEAASDVEIEGQLERSSYVLRVSDRGGGVARELRERLFEPFATGRRGGTGLGLAVCESIVRAHGGTIRAIDRNGGGTTFEVTVPVSAATLQHDAAPLNAAS